MDPMIQKIILSLEESIGKGKTLAYVKNLQKHLDKNQKSLKKYHKGTKDLSKANIKLAKSIFVVSKSVSNAKSAFFGMTKVLGAASLAAGAFFKTSDEFLAFSATASKGAAALRDLRDAYGDVGQAATISLERASAAITKFQSKGLAERGIAGSKQFIQGAVTLGKKLTTAVGSKAAGSMMDNLFTLQPEQLAGFEHAMTTLQVGSQEWADAMGAIGKANEAQSVAVALHNANNSLDPLIRSQIAWNNLLDSLATIADNAKVQILDAFGPTIQSALTVLKDDLVPGLIGQIKELIAWFKKNRDAIVGGMSAAYNAFKTFIDFVILAPNFVKAFAASWFFLPGFRQTLIAVGKQVLLLSGGFKSLATVTAPIAASLAAITFAYDQLFNKANEDTVGASIVDWLYADEFAKEGNKVIKTMTALQKAEAAESQIRIDAGKNKPGDNLPPISKYQDFINAITKVNALAPGAAALSTSIGNVSSIIKTFGPNAKIAGQSAQEFLKSLLAMSDESIAVGIEKANKAIAEARKLANTATDEQEKVQARQKLAEATAKLADYASLASAEIAAVTAADEARQRLIKSEIDIKKEDLRISQALYGTPALAVQAQVEVLKGMMAEKKLVEKQIVGLQELIKLKQGMPGMEGAVQEAQEKLNAKIKEGKSLTASQLELVKQLRDGYLDAVQAQAFGAGRFSKIIMTSEKNLMRSLEKRAAKENYLLGQFGQTASGTKAGGIAFGTTPGEMTTSGGQPLSKADLLAQNQARIGKMGGAGAAAAAKQAQDLVMGLSNDTVAIDSLLDNIIPKVAVAMGLKTGAVATTAVGGAMKAAANTRGPSGGATITSKGTNVTGPGGGNWESKFNNWGRFLKDFGRAIDQMNSAQGEGAGSSFIKPVINQP